MHRERNRQLALISLVELLAMGLWFSLSAVVPELREEAGLAESGAAWLTNSVQLGFVAGALLSAFLTLSDVWDPRRLIACSALLAAVTTAAIVAIGPDFAAMLALRFVTGMALAGVYPPAMKIVAGWFRRGRGLAIGILIGALAAGKSTPHLLRAGGGIGSWQPTLLIAAALAIVAAALAATVLRIGPYQAPAAPFDVRAVRRILGDRATMLANGGYFGHMWELYAMWIWIPAFLAASFEADQNARTTPEAASLMAFGTISAGAAGAVAAGVLADRFGRTVVASWAMAASAACCLVVGTLFGGSVWLLGAVCLVWGIAVVADSAQFSACVSELAEPEYVGTALTIQTALGFLLTTATIRLLPLWEASLGWRWAFAPLAAGPALGVWSMLALRKRPEAARIAGGRR